MARNYGAAPPPVLKWQIGRDKETIEFVQAAEGVASILSGEREEKCKARIAEIKAGSELTDEERTIVRTDGMMPF